MRRQTGGGMTTTPISKEHHAPNREAADPLHLSRQLARDEPPGLDYGKPITKGMHSRGRVGLRGTPSALRGQPQVKAVV